MESHGIHAACTRRLSVVFVCSLPILFLMLPRVSLAATPLAADGMSPLGICWGRVAFAPIPPPPIVSMLKANPNIARVKLFNADGTVLSALADLGTKAEVMVMVKNQELREIAVDPTAASGWLYQNVLTVLPTGVNIKYISVGNEPYLSQKQPYDDYLMLAVNRLQTALDKAELSPQIKLTVSFNSEILGDSSNVPSNGSFVPQWASQIANITSIINSTGSFFSVNIYPFFTYKDNQQIPLSYIMFGQGNSTNIVRDGKLTYTNILDASLDAVLAALARIGYPNIDVRIGEIGWPSDGNQFATLALSQQFNQLSVNHLLSGVGTPRRPNYYFVFYLFGLVDEDAKSIKPGPFERRWGLYNDLGAAKYNLDLSGNGDSSATLPKIPGLVTMQNRWCVASQDLSANPSSADNLAAMQSAVTDICGGDPSQSFDMSAQADCTPLTANLTSPGLQCAAASTSASTPIIFNVSFVLNQRYQVDGQSKNACTFNGLGVVVYEDPSTSSCTFQVGLDIEEIEQYYEPSTSWSWEVFGYLVALIVVLASFL